MVSLVKYLPLQSESLSALLFTAILTVHLTSVFDALTLDTRLNKTFVFSGVFFRYKFISSGTLKKNQLFVKTLVVVSEISSRRKSLYP